MKLKTLTILAIAALSLGNSHAADYTVDPVNSFVTFNIGHFGVGKAYGRFNEFSGSVSYDADNVSASKLSFAINAASVDTGNTKRDDHLRNNDFFDVVKFPKITFTSKSVTGGKITGDLTMHGVTKEITAPFAVAGVGTHPGKKVALLGASATFTVKRSDFGMLFGIDNGALADEVEITVAIEATAK